MSDFMAKMYQIQFRLGLRSRPRWGSLQRSPDLLAGLRGLLLREGERRGREGRGEGRGGEGTDSTPSRPPPNPYFWIRPCLLYVIFGLCQEGYFFFSLLCYFVCLLAGLLSYECIFRLPLGTRTVNRLL